MGQDLVRLDANSVQLGQVLVLSKGLMQNWGRLGIGLMQNKSVYNLQLGAGLVVRLPNKVDVSSRGCTLAQICFMFHARVSCVRVSFQVFV